MINGNWLGGRPDDDEEEPSLELEGGWDSGVLVDTEAIQTR